MSKLIKIMAGLAFVSIGLAAPAQADVYQDREFYRLLTEPDQEHPMVIWNFPEIRSEAIATCEREDAGETPYQALKDLQYPDGPYTFDVANDISSSADTMYCPSHTDPALPYGGTRMSTPLFPLPIYPPLAWYPE
jgi:hypothetical protein